FTKVASSWRQHRTKELRAQNVEGPDKSHPSAKMSSNESEKLQNFNDHSDIGSKLNFQNNMEKDDIPSTRQFQELPTENIGNLNHPESFDWLFSRMISTMETLNSTMIHIAQSLGTRSVETVTPDITPD